MYFRLLWSYDNHHFTLDFFRVLFKPGLEFGGGAKVKLLVDLGYLPDHTDFANITDEGGDFLKTLKEAIG